jgi:NADPH-dependent 2,4-dienoyl-CoA reductase/sulfur reductase-like enzyme
MSSLPVCSWGREIDYTHCFPPKVIKRVIVIGSGVAGIEAARVASMRGHKVTLHEKGKELGGQILLSAVPPGKEKMLWFRDYLVMQIKKQGVEIKLNCEVDTESIIKEEPNVVILATGARPSTSNISGIKGPNIHFAWDILAGQIKLKGKNIAVLGGGVVGCETAELLARHRNRVTIIEMLSDIANDMEPINRRVLLNEL